MWIKFCSQYIILEFSMPPKIHLLYISLWDEAFGQGSLLKWGPTESVGLRNSKFFKLFV